MALTSAVDGVEPKNSIASTDGAAEADVTAAILGDRVAFARLYDRHVDRVYRHVLYRMGRPADAEDVTQFVFLQAWRAISRYEQGKTPFVAWLLTIAHNAVVSHSRRSRDHDDLEVEPAASARWANPEAETFARYDRLVVRQAILRLRSDQQQVIVMRFIDNLDYAVIATALGKTEANIRVIQHRALVEMRRVLAHEVLAS